MDQHGSWNSAPKTRKDNKKDARRSWTLVDLRHRQAGEVNSSCLPGAGRGKVRQGRRRQPAMAIRTLCSEGRTFQRKHDVDLSTGYLGRTFPEKNMEAHMVWISKSHSARMNVEPTSVVPARLNSTMVHANPAIMPLNPRLSACHRRDPLRSALRQRLARRARPTQRDIQSACVPKVGRALRASRASRESMNKSVRVRRLRRGSLAAPP